MHYKIKAPIWKTRSVGINQALIDEDNMIEILYKNVDGERLYPDTYCISKEEALSYPTQVVSGVSLSIIPIANLKKQLTEQERSELLIKQGLI